MLRLVVDLGQVLVELKLNVEIVFKGCNVEIFDYFCIYVLQKFVCLEWFDWIIYLFDVEFDYECNCCQCKFCQCVEIIVCG